jgi:hypothetical protein
MSKHQQSIVYWANCVSEWQAKGWKEWEVKRMLACCLESVRSVHKNPAADAALVMEIANGARAA